ncbi:MAG: ABC transporter substrate-binding protein [Actinomycetota bacterium]|nr:ABC transporter substrate-binding protein [Actinomycetota bacterium]
MLKRSRLIAAVAAATVLVGACSSSKSGSSTSNTTTGSSSATTASSAGGGGTLTIGVLGDFTGAAASGNKTYINGIDAGLVLAKREGWNIKVVQADTATSPGTALSAAQKLVTQNNVPIVLTQSALAFAAAPYLNQHKIPVIGVAEDSSEWQTDLNMFAVGGALHITAVTTTFGLILKLLGATNVGSLGYGISPSSADSAKGEAKSALAAGLKNGYLNSNFPFGSTNVQPVAIAMKNAGVDAFYASVDPNTSFSLIDALRQQGVNLKAAILPDGYGADTLQAGPGALQSAQNVYFTLGFEPAEMNTPATKQLVADLAASGTTGVPTYGEYNGYVSIGLLLQALKSTGPNPTSASLTTALSNIHSWDGLGLWGGRTIDLNDRTNVLMTGECSWVTKLVGTKFELVPHATPICGSVIPGETAG